MYMGMRSFCWVVRNNQGVVGSGWWGRGGGWGNRRRVDYIQDGFFCDLLLELVLPFLPRDVKLCCGLWYQEGSDLLQDGDREVSKFYLPHRAEQLFPVAPHSLEGGDGVSKGVGWVTDELV